MTSALAPALCCPRCGQELPPETLQPGGAPCARCNTRVEAAVLPAFMRADEAASWSPVVSGEAGCFFHPDRVAAAACSRCGRFLCPLCRIQWPEGELCVACLEAARSSTAEHSLASSRFHFDSLALALSTFPILTWIFSLLSAPAALGFSIFTFRRECSIVPRSKIRFLLAILFSAATIAGWISFFVLYLIPHAGRTGRGPAD